MATLTFPLRIQFHIDDAKASIQSMAEALDNTHMDGLLDIEFKDGEMRFHGMTVARIKMGPIANPCTMTIKPTPLMPLMVGWLMAKLPDRATVTWRNGWPIFYCPPNDDRDYEDDPTPLVPDELVLA